VVIAEYLRAIDVLEVALGEVARAVGV
jgi:hypothetical protein